MAVARRFVRLTPALVQPALACIADTFAGEDPIGRALGLGAPHWASLAEPFLTRSASSGPASLSIVCVNAYGGVDGVMVNEDYTAKTPARYRTQLSPDWLPVRALFREANMRFLEAGPAPDVGELLHCLYFTCVRLDARGQGVMRGLWRETIDAARDARFGAVAAAASSEGVRQVLSENLGFTEASSVAYDEFVVGAPGSAPPFASLPARDPIAYSRLSISRRNVPSDLY